jgi:hypothetical protein
VRGFWVLESQVVGCAWRTNSLPPKAIICSGNNDFVPISMVFVVHGMHHKDY